MHPSPMLCSSLWQDDPKFLGTLILDAQLYVGITFLGVWGVPATGCCWV